MNYAEAFCEVETELQTIKNTGKIATYIPELSHVDPRQFGAHLTTINKEHYSLGDSQTKFSIQSIFKVLALTLARGFDEDHLWNRVGVEPSGSPFNSLVQLEYEQGIPRNPLINAGAMVVCDVLLNHLPNPRQDFIKFVRGLAGDTDIDYCSRVATSERLTGHKNAAMINLIKSYGNITHDIDKVLDFYCDLCSIEMSCKQLAQAFLYLATDGVNPINGEMVISARKSKRINAIMQLCGFYDEAGEFAFKVGLPGKSGVGGGIVAVHPDKYSIAVWSPPLNAKGNSFMGMKFLELFTTRTESSIF
ncbi:L-glutaminase [Desulfuromusa kysingii]|uniref:Glutaminase n=1 Tax=Desulfuromusa kysingii TaxID=37625 RepID=A0A1H4BX97_9BACT|nr:glutaminase [Desulfuromusa kysingii]SEA52709.1 L-glutaminase [Desulfuromusa kysingii]